ncbi:MAG TPA: hypothetical protein VLT62_22875 [Candidatus Methylomirabilis sp.]|nr:hypothetical protein [Candidatus Methylomirabilis sp.]
MRIHWVFTVPTALLLVVLPAWLAQLTPLTMPGQPSPAVVRSQATDQTRRTDEVRGKIKSVSQSGEEVILEDETKLVIPDSLKEARRELRSGGLLRATYAVRNGQKVVTSIDVRPA